MKYVDLNSDLGESFGNYTCGRDEDVLLWITSANVACGFHAGDPLVMSRTVEMAIKEQTAVGAHPGFPDLVGFGRRNLDVSFPELKAMVQYQVGALKAFCDANGVPLQHVKPHGAMYNMAAKNETLAAAIAEGIAEVDPKLILLALSGSKMIDAAKRAGIPYASEVFADRAYEEDGSLVSRKKEGAMITDANEAIGRVIEMVKEGTVTAITGKKIEICADSICVHGDSVHAVEFARLLNWSLTAENIQIAPLTEVIAHR